MSETPPHVGRATSHGPGFGGETRPSYPPWAIWEALLVFALFMASQPLLSLLGVEIARAFLPSELPAAAAREELLRNLVPLVLLISHVIGWAAIAHLILSRHHLSFSEGLRLRGMGGFRPLLLIGGGMGLQWGGRVIGELIQSSQGLENQTSRYLALGGWAIMLLAAMAVVMAPLLEEALFRGILQPALKRRLGFALAALTVTAVFTATHLSQFIDYPPALVLIFVCGGILSLLREAADSLWPPILFHFGFNLAAMLPLLFFSKEMLRGM
ncbi:MAG: CPBP family intramembrane glutamic endopeptidase [bacterium]